MRPDVLRVREVVDEGPGIRTVFWKREYDVEAGEFGMFWIPGVDEVPMSFAYPDGITVRGIGEATRAINSLEPGDRLGVRGPFGTTFEPPDKGDDVVIVGGGTGMAPVALLTEEASMAGADVTTLIGAATEEELIFEGRLSEHADVRVATEDGSKGHEGYVTELLDDHRDADYVASCGPEPMMAKVLDRYDSSRVQVSLERYMKCGIGICGSCCIDDTGSPVCTDGPVYRGTEVEGGEFGVYHRDAASRIDRF
ncbi:MAG: dihydroorotate dehydrogenase electron transfer subunit [Halobacteria archaeon]